MRLVALWATGTLALAVAFAVILVLDTEDESAIDIVGGIIGMALGISVFGTLDALVQTLTRKEK